MFPFEVLKTTCYCEAVGFISRRRNNLIKSKTQNLCDPLAMVEVRGDHLFLFIYLLIAVEFIVTFYLNNKEF